VQNNLVANGDVITDHSRLAARTEPAVVSDVNDRSILDAGARADADALDVSAHDAHWPDRTVLANFDIADDQGSFIDIGGRMDLGRILLKKTNGHD